MKTLLIGLCCLLTLAVRAAQPTFANLPWTNNLGVVSLIGLERFEGSFPPSGWTTTGNSVWVKDTSVFHEGHASAKSDSLSDSQSNIISLTVTGPGLLSFWWKVSSEQNFDFLGFYDNNSGNPSNDGDWGSNPGVVRISGDIDWTNRLYAVSAGSHILRWIYAKDSSSSDGSNAGYLDSVQFTTVSNLIIAVDVYISGGIGLGGSTNISLGNQPFQQNTWLGEFALEHFTTNPPLRTVAIGYGVLRNLTSLTTGSDNTGVGRTTLSLLTNGVHNTTLGSSAAFALGHADENTVVGDDAFFIAAEGFRNTVVGRLALPGAGTMSDNTAIGYHAGASSTGNQNIFLGSQTDVSTAGLSNVVALGYGANATTNNQFFVAPSLNQTNGGSISAAGGFASFSSIATNAITATGVTNISGLDRQAIVTATAISFTINDRAGAVLYTSPTLTATLNIRLQNGWSIRAASGLAGTVIP